MILEAVGQAPYESLCANGSASRSTLQHSRRNAGRRLALLTTSAVAQGVATKYAAGWFDDRAFGHRRLSHGGNVPGFTVRSTVFPDDDFQIVVAMNSTDSDARSIDNRVAALLLGGITDAQIQAVLI